jgi:hypothetical protein
VGDGAISYAKTVIQIYPELHNQYAVNVENLNQAEAYVLFAGIPEW